MKKYLFLIAFLIVPFCTSIAQVATSYYDEGSFIMTGSSAIQSIANANPTTIELSSELVSKKMNSYKKEDLEDPNRQSWGQAPRYAMYFVRIDSE